MLTVSPEYRSAILPGSDAIRKTDVRVTIKLSDFTGTLTGTQSGGAPYSDATQLIDHEYDVDYAVVTCEPDRWHLDGTCAFGVPDQIGFVSNEMSDINGDFSVFAYAKITLSAGHEPAWLTIFFDRLNDEYAVNFTLDFTASGVSVETVNIIGNTEKYYRYEVPALAGNIDAVTIVITKWSEPYHRAKISEMQIGLVQQWGHGADTNMLSNYTINEIDRTMRTAPYGTSTTKVYNVDNDFNPVSPDGLALALTEGAEMTVEHGVYVNGRAEYVKTGTYRFDSWRETDNAQVELLGVDTLGYFGHERVRSKYGWSTGGSQVLQYLADVLATSDLPSSLIDYAFMPIVDDGFVSAPTNNNLIETLRQLAQWNQRILVTDADGVIRFKDTSSIVATDTIDLADVIGDQKITRNKVPKYIHVNVYHATLPAATEEIAKFTETFTGNRTYSLWLGYDVSATSVAVTGAVSYGYNSQQYGYMTLFIEGGGSPVTVTITGQRWEITNTVRTVTNPFDAADKNTSISIDNKFIGTTEKAEEIGLWIAGLMIDTELEYQFNWRGNPSIEMTDIQTVETKYGDALMTVTRQDLSYDGTLTSHIEGVRSSLG